MTKMEFHWIDDLPIFVFMDFIDHGIFDVVIKTGVRGDQNAPRSKHKYLTHYRQKGIRSRLDVAFAAEKVSRILLKKLKDLQKAMNEFIPPEHHCPHCGSYTNSEGNYDCSEFEDDA